MLEAIPFGLVIGLAVGLLGGGGSVLAVPVLVYALNQGVGEATTASLVVVAAGALAGGVGHARAGRVCWRHAGTFTAAALPGIGVGTVAGNAAGGNLLLAAFAAVMLAAAQATWRGA
ncbi:MAG: TSUP family transporter, partial [Actinomycetota bacterium]|nr:TSUP family transporter [Actinomycetota bacterium]